MFYRDYKSNKRPYRISVDQNQQEIIAGVTDELTFHCGETDYNRVLGQKVPWHWHPSIEINYVVEGEADYETSAKQYHLKKGEAIFVNSNVLHRTVAPRAPHAHLEYSLKFEPAFLSGIYGNPLEQKYVMPILQSTSLDSWLIRPEDAAGIRMLGHFLKIVELCKEDAFGYEFEVRHELAGLWLELLSVTSEERSAGTVSGSQDAARIKPMLNYIREHYGEKISLDDIAAAGNISRREATRCFSRSIRQSPGEYLKMYRVRTAMRRLLLTNDSVAQISDECGFTSPAYFTKVFAQETGVTPAQYRKAHAESR